MGICLAKSLTHNISEARRDRRVVSKDHSQETTHCESNGHVTDDVTQHNKVKVMLPKFSTFYRSSTTVQTDGWFKLTTYRKP